MSSDIVNATNLDSVTRAATDGSALAARRLSRHLDTQIDAGIRPEADRTKAQHWLLVAAERGDAVALYEYGMLFAQDADAQIVAYDCELLLRSLQVFESQARVKATELPSF